MCMQTLKASENSSQLKDPDEKVGKVGVVYYGGDRNIPVTVTWGVSVAKETRQEGCGPGRGWGQIKVSR